MGWKPCQGSGITFDNAFNREMKYRCQLSEFRVHPVGFMQWSKVYYHWLVAERDMQRLQFPSSCESIEQLYGRCIDNSTLQSFEQHKELCYKSLQRLMP
jgi:hypothetical protein